MDMVFAFLCVIDTKDEVPEELWEKDLLFMVTVFWDGHPDTVSWIEVISLIQTE